MERSEYDRKFRQSPGSLPQADGPMRASGEIVLPLEVSDQESRRQLDEAGFDYNGSEAWIEFMRRLGRL